MKKFFRKLFSIVAIAILSLINPIAPLAYAVNCPDNGAETLAYFSACDISYNINGQNITLSTTFTLNAFGVAQVSGNTQNTIPYICPADGACNNVIVGASQPITLDTNPQTHTYTFNNVPIGTYSNIGWQDSIQVDIGDPNNYTQNLFTISSGGGVILGAFTAMPKVAFNNIGDIVKNGLEKILLILACLMGFGILMVYVGRWIGGIQHKNAVKYTIHRHTPITWLGGATERRKRSRKHL